MSESSRKSYRMILFDFFNTLVVPDASRQPMLEVEGRRVVSTAAILQRRLAGRYPGIDVMQVYRAMEAAGRKIGSQRGTDYRELPALERFREVAVILGCGGPGDEFPRELLEIHMEAVTAAFRFPPEHRALLERLRSTHRLGIFSNFDHAPALLRLLGDNGVREWFEPIVISETIGFRKPGDKAFRHALALAGEPRERILFVGDSLKYDVRGALQAHMDVAWINRDGTPAPPDARPTYLLENLEGLEALLLNA